MFESSRSEDLEFADSLVHVGDDGCCQVLVTNPTGFTQKLSQGSLVGLASEADHVSAIDMDSCSTDDGDVVQEGRVDGGDVVQEGIGLMVVNGWYWWGRRTSFHHLLLC